MITIRDGRDFLFVRVPQTGDAYDWWVCDPSGNVNAHGSGNLQALLPVWGSMHQAKVCLILPAASSCLLLLPAALKVAGKLGIAAPFLVEEQIIADIESQQVALLAGDPPVAAIIDRAILDGYLKPFHEAGMVPEAAWPEHWLWSGQQAPALVALHITNGVAWFLQNSEPVVCLPAQVMVDWLSLVYADANEERQQLVILASSQDEKAKSDFLSILPMPVQQHLQWQAEPCKPVLPLPRDTATTGILQGSYLPKLHWRDACQRWWPVIMATMILLAGHTAFLGWQQWRVQHEMATFDQNFLALFKQVNPGGRAVNPRVQLTQLVTNLAANQKGQFIPLFYGFATRVHSVEGVTIGNVQYDRSSHQLLANLHAPDMAALERVLSGRDDGMQVRLNSSARQPDGLLASVTAGLSP